MSNVESLTQCTERKLDEHGEELSDNSLLIPLLGPFEPGSSIAASKHARSAKSNNSWQF